MVIIFPTDTVYGIGTPIFDIEGINKIYDIKKRPKDKPLACLCANLKQIEEIACVSDDARKLINKFLPGALTVILDAKPIVKEMIGYNTIGIRIPNSKLAISILEENGAMLTTSVNDSGDAPINEYTEIVAKYTNLVDKIYDRTEDSSNMSSTVVKITNGVEILRVGEISKEDILNCLNS